MSYYKWKKNTPHAGWAFPCHKCHKKTEEYYYMTTSEEQPRITSYCPECWNNLDEMS